MRHLLLLLFPLIVSCGLSAQGSPLPHDDAGYDLIRRLSIRYGYDGFQRPATDLSLRPTGRAGLVRLARTYEQLYGENFSKADRYRVRRFLDDNNEWLSLEPFGSTEDGDRAAYYLGEDFALAAREAKDYRTTDRKIFNLFYPTPAHLLEVNRPDFYLRVNPIVDLRYGKQKDDAEDYFFNRRGVALRAGIDDRIFFHFDILETQAGLPNFVREFRSRFEALPGAGFLKSYSLDLANVSRGADYLNGSGFVSADLTKHVGVRLGYGRHFIGDGERSMLLSNFSNNYPFLELNWRIWKFHYRNLFAELTAAPGRPSVIVLSRDEGFDLAYLNPIILYRTIEQSVGSPDNALVGLTGRYRSPFRTEFYGQFILDEFVFNELFVERRGWWANKWAYQVGARHVDAFGVDQLDIMVERNVARPFTYAHRAQSSYTHFGMPLAHPLGANFTENIIGIDYRPLPRLHLRARLHLIDQGEETNTEGESIGENIYLSSSLRTMDFGNEIGQGINYSNTLLNLRASYEMEFLGAKI